MDIKMAQVPQLPPVMPPRGTQIFNMPEEKSFLSEALESYTTFEKRKERAEDVKFRELQRLEQIKQHSDTLQQRKDEFESQKEQFGVTSTIERDRADAYIRGTDFGIQNDALKTVQAANMPADQKSDSIKLAMEAKPDMAANFGYDPTKPWTIEEDIPRLFQMAATKLTDGTPNTIEDILKFNTLGSATGVFDTNDRRDNVLYSLDISLEDKMKYLEGDIAYRKTLEGYASYFATDDRGNVTVALIDKYGKGVGKGEAIVGQPVPGLKGPTRPAAVVGVEKPEKVPILTGTEVTRELRAYNNWIFSGTPAREPTAEDIASIKEKALAKWPSVKLKWTDNIARNKWVEEQYALMRAGSPAPATREEGVARAIQSGLLPTDPRVKEALNLRFGAAYKTGDTFTDPKTGKTYKRTGENQWQPI